MITSPVLEPDTVLESNGDQLTPLPDTVFDPAEFGIFLRQRMQGKTVAQVAALLGASENYVARMLEGRWRPTKAIAKRLGLRIAYVVPGQPRRVSTAVRA